MTFADTRYILRIQTHVTFAVIVFSASSPIEFYPVLTILSCRALSKKIQACTEVYLLQLFALHCRCIVLGDLLLCLFLQKRFRRWLLRSDEINDRGITNPSLC